MNSKKIKIIYECCWNKWRINRDIRSVVWLLSKIKFKKENKIYLTYKLISSELKWQRISVDVIAHWRLSIDNNDGSLA